MTIGFSNERIERINEITGHGWSASDLTRLRIAYNEVANVLDPSHDSKFEGREFGIDQDGLAKAIFGENAEESFIGNGYVEIRGRRGMRDGSGGPGYIDTGVTFIFLIRKDATHEVIVDRHPHVGTSRTTAADVRKINEITHKWTIRELVDLRNAYNRMANSPYINHQKPNHDDYRFGADTVDIEKLIFGEGSEKSFRENGYVEVHGTRGIWIEKEKRYVDKGIHFQFRIMKDGTHKGTWLMNSYATGQ